MQQEEVQKENRRRNPQLNDLLNPDQMTVARSGNKDQITALFAYLDPEKRPMVARPLPPQSLAHFPELRREAQRQRAAPAGGERGSQRGQGFSRAIFQPAVGRSAGGFLVQPL